MFLMLTVVCAQDLPEPSEDVSVKEESQDTEEGLQDRQKEIEDLKNDVLGLEFYLQDKKDYKCLCPATKWEQPKLEEYKKDPKSYLPKGCKKVENK